MQINFEFLSISYIISEFFLLSLCLMLQELDSKKTGDAAPPEKAVEEVAAPPVCEPPQRSNAQSLSERCTFFASQISTLTPTEHRIFRMYLSGKSTKEVLASLNIKENTLKYHNKNLYSKLGVASRKQLQEIAEILQLQETEIL